MYLLLPHQLANAQIEEVGEPTKKELDTTLEDTFDLDVVDMQPVFDKGTMKLSKRQIMFPYFAASKIGTDEQGNITHATGRWMQLIQHIYIPDGDKEGFTLPLDIPPADKQHINEKV